MTTNTVAITGANGYLGKHLARTYRERGYLVQALSRTAPEANSDYTSHFSFELGASLKSEALATVDTLIHCAHDFSGLSLKESLRVNLEGSIKLFEAAHAAAVRRIIFISSMAAFTGCKSVYGQTKLAIENEGAKFSVLSVRPGTIWGGQAGGLFRSLEKLALGPPIVPLLCGKSLKLYLVEVHELCAAILNLAAADAFSEPVMIANPNPVSLAEIIRQIAKVNGRKPVFFPIPVGVVYVGLKYLESLGLKPPFRSDSLLSLSNPNPSPDFSALLRLGPELRPYL